MFQHLIPKFKTVGSSPKYGYGYSYGAGGNKKSDKWGKHRRSSLEPSLN